jgi:hypothetical protein
MKGFMLVGGVFLETNSGLGLMEIGRRLSGNTECGEIKRNNEVILNELWRLVEIGRKKELVLLCWCKPLPCHGDVVKSCLEWMDKNK